MCKCDCDYDVLRQQWRCGKYCDLSIQSTMNGSEKIIRCHKIIVTSFSPVLRRDLDILDRNTIYLPNVDEDTLEFLIEYMYSAGKMSITLSMENVFRILRGAKELQLSFLQQTCVKLLEDNLSVPHITSILKVALEIEDDRVLLTKSANYFLENFQAFKILVNGNDDLDFKTLQAVIKHRNKLTIQQYVSSEEMLKLIVGWLDNMQNKEEKDADLVVQYANALLEEVVLDEIPRYSFYQIYQAHPFLQHIPKLAKYCCEISEDTSTVVKVEDNDVVQSDNSCGTGQVPNVQCHAGQKIDNFYTCDGLESGRSIETHSGQELLLSPEVIIKSESNNPTILSKDPPITINTPIVSSNISIMSSSIPPSTSDIQSVTSNQPPTSSISTPNESNSPLIYFLAKHPYLQYQLCSINLMSRKISAIATANWDLRGHSVFHNNGELFMVECLCFFLPGSRFRRSIRKYSVTTKKWTFVGYDLPTERNGFSSEQMVGMGDSLYIIGGLGNNEALPLAYRLDLFEPGQWQSTYNSGSFDFILRYRTRSLPNLTVPRNKCGVCTIGGCIFTVGGYSATLTKCGLTPVLTSLECFDSVVNRWQERAQMPNPRMGLTVAVVDSHYIYVMGGRSSFEDEDSSLDSVDIYDSIGNTWRAGTPMSVKRQEFSAVAVNNYIYAFGGDSNTTPTWERFDLRQNVWEFLGELPAHGIYRSVALQMHQNENPETGDDENKTDNKKETISPTLLPLTKKHKKSHSEQVDGEKLMKKSEITFSTSDKPIIYFLRETSLDSTAIELLSFNLLHQVVTVVSKARCLEGSWVGRSLLFFKSRLYDISQRGTSPCSSLHVNILDSGAMQGFPFGTWNLHTQQNRTSSASLVICRGILYIIGGLSADGEAVSDARRLGFQRLREHILDLKTIRTGWRYEEVLASMNYPRYKMGLVDINGCVYAVGGFSDLKCSTYPHWNKIECFDPSKNAWEEKSPMLNPRLEPAVVAYQSRLYVLGGCSQLLDPLGNCEKLNTVDVYDPLSNTWSLGVRMIKKRHKFSAVVWEGSIYAIGGDSDRLQTYERFSSKDNSWELMGNSPMRANYAVVALHQND